MVRALQKACARVRKSCKCEPPLTATLHSNVACSACYPTRDLVRISAAALPGSVSQANRSEDHAGSSETCYSATLPTNRLLSTQKTQAAIPFEHYVQFHQDVGVSCQVDVDEHPKLKAIHNVHRLPEILLFRNGMEKGFFKDEQTSEAIVSVMTKEKVSRPRGPRSVPHHLLQSQTERQYISSDMHGSFC